ncbi:hypothetical protein IFM89_007513 [Coptis chinensis]|uniref:Uncharacterized protein n=1 Tax=Coptis chinensis TaxID=261450 RepID=A0A835I1S7_9MAGN|nr:hypothetical protein IFM89_007513 [Coptis chinensis]
MSLLLVFGAINKIKELLCRYRGEKYGRKEEFVGKVCCYHTLFKAFFLFFYFLL